LDDEPLFEDLPELLGAEPLPEDEPDGFDTLPPEPDGVLEPERRVTVPEPLPEEPELERRETAPRS
jgi:hypothetical protein